MIQKKSAAEIRKGEQSVMILSEADVERFMRPRELLDELREGFKQSARGEIQVPPRPEITTPKGFMLSMIETISRVTNNQAKLELVSKTIRLGKELLARPIELIEGNGLTCLRFGFGRL